MEEGGRGSCVMIHLHYVVRLFDWLPGGGGAKGGDGAVGGAAATSKFYPA